MGGTPAARRIKASHFGADRDVNSDAAWRQYRDLWAAGVE